MKKKIAQIGPYPPPETGWSVRIKELKLEIERTGNDCKVLNIGSNRNVKSDQYIGVQNGLDYILKLIFLRFKGYRFHIHGNAQAVKGPLLCLIANIISVITFKAAFMTFHGGYSQLYFPKRKAGKMYWIIYLNFLLSRKIICNDETIKQFISEYGLFIDPYKIYPIQAFSTQYLNYEKVPLPEKINNFMADKEYTVFSYIALRHGYHLEAFTEYIENAPEQIAFIITGVGKVEDNILEPVFESLLRLEQEGKVILIPSMSHDEFMCLMSKTDVYLRTHYSDGVSSSVLEALVSGAVVVACENGRRPDGVITYEPDSAQDLADKMVKVLNDLDHYKSEVKKPEIINTLAQEIDVLFDR